MAEINNVEFLIIERSNLNADILSNEFSHAGILPQVTTVNSTTALLESLSNKSWIAIFICIDEIHISIDILKAELKNKSLDLPLIVILQNYDRDQALTLLSLGADNVFSINELPQLSLYIQSLLSNISFGQTDKNLKIEIDQDQQNIKSLIDQSSMAIALIQDGFFIHQNPAFLNLINRSETLTSTSLLDIVDKTDQEIIKTKIQAMTKNESSSAETIQNISIKISDQRRLRATIHLSSLHYAGESCLQINLIQENHASSIKTQNMFELSPEHFIQTLNNVIRSRQINPSHTLCFFEINEYIKFKKNNGILRTEHIVLELINVLAKLSNDDTYFSPFTSDVYAILIQCDTHQNCIEKIETLQTDLQSYGFNQPEHIIKFSFNIGLVHLNQEIENTSQALSFADVACTVSRNKKQNKVHIYNPEIDRTNVESLDQNWQERITDAIKNDNFTLNYQPIISLSNKQDKTYDAFLLMKISGQKNISASEFMHFSNQSSLALKIDQWMIQQINEAIYTQSGVKIFTQISPRSLVDIHFTDWIKSNISKNIKQFIFKIAEQTTIELPSESLHFQQEMHRLGAGVCINNFGNNPNTQQQNEILQADYLKIDDAFLHNLATNRKHQSIIHNIGLAAKLNNAKTIASFIQDADSMAVLWQENIDYVQGDYISKASPKLDYNFDAPV